LKTIVGNCDLNGSLSLTLWRSLGHCGNWCLPLASTYLIVRLKRNLKTTARAIFYEKTEPCNFGWQMYDTPFRSYDAQLGRFHQIDPLADLAPGINPYRFGFNNPISLNDPTGLYERSMQDIYDEAFARSTSEGTTSYRYVDGKLVRVVVNNSPLWASSNFGYTFPIYYFPSILRGK
jgi:RHS repeat-associated protein